MGILSGYKRFKKYLRTAEGYRLCSEWTNADSVEMTDGSTLQESISSLHADVSSLNDEISSLNGNLADSLGGMTFGIDEEGNYGYIKAGADTVTPFKSGLEFTWLADRLAGYLNLPNTGHVTLETLTQNIGGNIGIYGTNSPNELTLANAVNLGAYTTTNVGHTATIDTGNEYPYIILYCIYNANGWNAAVKISI